MKCWPLLRSLDADLDPVRCKIHLAVHNGTDDPLDIYRAGTYPDWQAWQSRGNFEREFVIAFVQLPGINQWLFAGAYTSQGRVREGTGYRYDLPERLSCSELNGRLVVNFTRSGRQSYLDAENWADQVVVSEIRRDRLTTPAFPGFKGLHISKAQLDQIVRENDQSWRAALSSVAGVYLISDSKSGRFYVGSACGKGGFWDRWVTYSTTCHGGNRDLKKLLGADPVKRAASLQYSVLEIADTHASYEEILGRESHWKSVLMTRIHGLNAN